MNTARGPTAPVEATLPDEGSTGWSDTWMMYSEAAHPNCMLMWMDHMMSAEANAQATVWFGEAPTSHAACEAAEAISPGHCDTFHATDEAYFDRVWYWSTPQEDCADDDDGDHVRDAGGLGRGLDHAARRLIGPLRVLIRCSPGPPSSGSIIAIGCDSTDR